MIRRTTSSDEGSAVVEFVTLGVLLLVPVVYLVLTLGRIQAGAFAAEAGAREAARAFTTADDEASATAHAHAAVALSLLDQGFDPTAAADALTVRCDGARCLSPGVRVHVRVVVDVPLPATPRFVTAVVPAAVTVDAEAVAVVERFR